MSTKVSIEDADQYVPNSVRNLEACSICLLILAKDQWNGNECPNCNERTEKIFDYGGIVSLMDPKHSWVARWNKF